MKEGEFPCTGRLPHRQAQGGAVESQKAGHIRAGNRKSCTFSAHKNLTDYGPSQMVGLGTNRRPQKTHGTEGEPRGPGEARHTNLCSHKPQDAEPGPQELKEEYKNPMT